MNQNVSRSTVNASTDIKQIVVSKLNLTFGMKQGDKPKALIYELRGESLTENIIITAFGQYQISLMEEINFANTLTVKPTFEGRIYVQLIGIENGEYSGKVTHTSKGTPGITIKLNGYVADGSKTYPFPVTSADSLYQVREDLKAVYKQYCDIDLKSYGQGHGKGWDPIGTLESPFVGQYDGGGFMIDNLYFYSDLEDHKSIIGLFGTIENATLRNIRMYRASISAFASGILVGNIATNSDIINCHVRNSFTGGRGNSGLVNDMIGGQIDRCSSVTSARLYTCGYSGIFGTANGTTITKCWAKVDIQYATENIEYKWQSDTFCGFGQTAFGCKISDCYAIGKTLGRLWQCGFLQNFDFDYNEFIPSIIKNCYAAVVLKSIADTLPPPYYSKDPMTGGFVYEVSKDSCQDFSCYFDLDLAGTKLSAIGKALTTSEMQNKATFMDWDFTKTWTIKNQSYPTLQENPESL